MKFFENLIVKYLDLKILSLRFYHSFKTLLSFTSIEGSSLVTTYYFYAARNALKSFLPPAGFFAGALTVTIFMIFSILASPGS